MKGLSFTQTKEFRFLSSMAKLSLMICQFTRSSAGNQHAGKPGGRSFQVTNQQRSCFLPHVILSLQLCSSPSLPVLSCRLICWAQGYFLTVLWGKSPRSVRSRALPSQTNIKTDMEQSWQLAFLTLIFMARH